MHPARPWTRRVFLTQHECCVFGIENAKLGCRPADHRRGRARLLVVKKKRRGGSTRRKRLASTPYLHLVRLLRLSHVSAARVAGHPGAGSGELASRLPVIEREVE